MALRKENTDIGSSMESLLTSSEAPSILKQGDTVKGKVVSVSSTRVFIDLGGLATGIIYGGELEDDLGNSIELTHGQEISATVLNPETDEGYVELSFKRATREQAWQHVHQLLETGEPVTTTILEANRGGLMAKIEGITGFLPVSQLTPEHYPRVENANKELILHRLAEYVGKSFTVRVIGVDRGEEKLIVSEKAAYADQQRAELGKLTVGDAVEGSVSGVMDFGLFVRFGSLEGLVHISEVAWQRIDDVHKVARVGDRIKVRVIGIEEGKLSLSMKRLTPDPWENASTRFKVGDPVKGIITKVTPFGAFVKLDDEIHGLLHISEMGPNPVKDPNEIVKEGEAYTMKIISFEPAEHRLGLSMKIEVVKEPAAASLQASSQPEPGEAQVVAVEQTKPKVTTRKTSSKSTAAKKTTVTKKRAVRPKKE